MNDIAWKYLNDGCYARAHLIAKRLEKEGIETGKVWIKGDLSIPNKNLHWNFHVAPIVYIDKGNNVIERIVIDPSISTRPLTVKEWSSKMKKGVIGPEIRTSFPFPQNAINYERTAIAFSSSAPYLPDDSLKTTEEEKLNQARVTMKRYKLYEGKK